MNIIFIGHIIINENNIKNADDKFKSNNILNRSEDENRATMNDTATEKLAVIESTGELQGMAELYAAIRERPLRIKAYALDDPSVPTTDDVVVKTIHFVRHGQGFHNLTADLFVSEGKVWEAFAQTPDNPYVMPEVMDAPLTQKGRDQAGALQPVIRELEKDGDGSSRPKLIVSSTLCRALQTASIAFGDLIGGAGADEGASVPFIAHEMVREAMGAHICDKRRPISQQKREFPWVDFEGVELEEDTLFNPSRRETKMETGKRIYEFMLWLSKRKENNLAVVSHSCWLLTLFNGVVECDDWCRLWFATGEMRSVKLVFTEKN